MLFHSVFVVKKAPQLPLFLLWTPSFYLKHAGKNQKTAAAFSTCCRVVDVRIKAPGEVLHYVITGFEEPRREKAAA